MKLDHKLRAVAATLQTACDFVVAFTAAARHPSSPDAEGAALVAQLWASKMCDRHLSSETELAAHVRVLLLRNCAQDRTSAVMHDVSCFS